MNKVFLNTFFFFAHKKYLFFLLNLFLPTQRLCLHFREKERGKKEEEDTLIALQSSKYFC